MAFENTGDTVAVFLYLACFVLTSVATVRRARLDYRLSILLYSADESLRTSSQAIDSQMPIAGGIPQPFHRTLVWFSRALSAGLILRFIYFIARETNIIGFQSNAREAQTDCTAGIDCGAAITLATIDRLALFAFFIAYSFIVMMFVRIKSAKEVSAEESVNRGRTTDKRKIKGTGNAQSDRNAWDITYLILDLWLVLAQIIVAVLAFAGALSTGSVEDITDAYAIMMAVLFGFLGLTALYKGVRAFQHLRAFKRIYSSILGRTVAGSIAGGTTGTAKAAAWADAREHLLSAHHDPELQAKGVNNFDALLRSAIYSQKLGGAGGAAAALRLPRPRPADMGAYATTTLSSGVDGAAVAKATASAASMSLAANVAAGYRMPAQPRQMQEARASAGPPVLSERQGGPAARPPRLALVAPAANDAGGGRQHMMVGPIGRPHMIQELNSSPDVSSEPEDITPHLSSAKYVAMTDLIHSYPAAATSAAQVDEEWFIQQRSEVLSSLVRDLSKSAWRVMVLMLAVVISCVLRCVLLAMYPEFARGDTGDVSSVIDPWVYYVLPDIVVTIIAVLVTQPPIRCSYEDVHGRRVARCSSRGCHGGGAHGVARTSTRFCCWWLAETFTCCASCGGRCCPLCKSACYAPVRACYRCAHTYHGASDAANQEWMWVSRVIASGVPARLFELSPAQVAAITAMDGDAVYVPAGPQLQPGTPLLPHQPGEYSGYAPAGAVARYQPPAPHLQGGLYDTAPVGPAKRWDQPLMAADIEVMLASQDAEERGLRGWKLAQQVAQLQLSAAIQQQQQQQQQPRRAALPAAARQRVGVPEGDSVGTPEPAARASAASDEESVWV